MEGTDGGLHPAVDGQKPRRKVKQESNRQTTMEGIDRGGGWGGGGYILQWMDKA